MRPRPAPDGALAVRVFNGGTAPVRATVYARTRPSGVVFDTPWPVTVVVAPGDSALVGTGRTLGGGVFLGLDLDLQGPCEAQPVCVETRRDADSVRFVARSRQPFPLLVRLARGGDTTVHALGPGQTRVLAALDPRTRMSAWRWTSVPGTPRARAPADPFRLPVGGSTRLAVSYTPDEPHDPRTPLALRRRLDSLHAVAGIVPSTLAHGFLATPRAPVQAVRAGVVVSARTGEAVETRADTFSAPGVRLVRGGRPPGPPTASVHVAHADGTIAQYHGLDPAAVPAVGTVLREGDRIGRLPTGEARVAVCLQWYDASGRLRTVEHAPFHVGRTVRPLRTGETLPARR